jgi:hypothetical protein
LAERKLAIDKRAQQVQLPRQPRDLAAFDAATSLSALLSDAAKLFARRTFDMVGTKQSSIAEWIQPNGYSRERLTAFLAPLTAVDIGKLDQFMVDNSLVDPDKAVEDVDEAAGAAVSKYTGTGADEPS